MASAKRFDVVVYGASGYTGRLVCEYMARRYKSDGPIAWAMAGRNASKLAQVRDEIGAPADTPMISVDATDTASIEAMVDSAKVVCTTVGPYQLYGEVLVAACAARGTDYVDLCGEPAWMRMMIDAHEEAAKKSGARIVFSCGFDSIPFDLGVYFLQEHAKQTLGGVVARVKCRVQTMQGGFSGGTVASLGATMEAAAKDPKILELLNAPFALTPGFEGPEQPSGMTPMLDDAVGSWVAPFIMAPINTKNVHRSNALMGHAYGTDFVYDEMMITGPGEEGEKMAHVVANTDPFAGDDVPKPGEGPSKEEREAGHYDLVFIGEANDGRTIKVRVKGDKDPGYGSTSKMIAESAVCLITDCADKSGGIYTPAAVFGSPIIKRLREHAGLTFDVED